MSFRDDGDAARARVVALEADLAWERHRRDEARSALDEVARERERLAVEAEKRHAEATQPSTVVPLDPRSALIVKIFGTAYLIFAVVGLVVHFCR